MKKTVLSLSLLALSLATTSAIAAEAPSWNFVKASYVSMDLGDNFEPTGFGITGTKLIGESNFFVTASLVSLTEDFQGYDVDIATLDGNLGYKYGVTDSTDVFASIGMGRVAVEVAGFKETDNVTLLGLGVRTMLTDSFEVNVALEYASADGESDTGFTLGARYHITETISVELDYASADDVDTTMVSASWNF